MLPFKARVCNFVDYESYRMQIFSLFSTNSASKTIKSMKWGVNTVVVYH